MHANVIRTMEITLAYEPGDLSVIPRGGGELARSRPISRNSFWVNWQRLHGRPARQCLIWRDEQDKKTRAPPYHSALQVRTMQGRKRLIQADDSRAR
jgi:hypothetical protein